MTFNLHQGELHSRKLRDHGNRDCVFILEKVDKMGAVPNRKSG